jgi:hypothetical protein
MSGLSWFDNQPGPARTEATQAGFFEFGFKVIEGAKCGVDGSSKLTSRCATFAGAHQGPEKGVIPVSSTVVADGTTDGFRHIIDLAAEIVEAQRLQIRMALQGGIEIGDVGLVVLRPVNVHGGLVDVRLEGVFSVGEFG